MDLKFTRIYMHVPNFNKHVSDQLQNAILNRTCRRVYWLIGYRSFSCISRIFGTKIIHNKSDFMLYTRSKSEELICSWLPTVIISVDDLVSTGQLINTPVLIAHVSISPVWSIKRAIFWSQIAIPAT